VKPIFFITANIQGSIRWHHAHEIGGLSMSTPEHRKLWKLFFKAHSLAFKEWEERGYRGTVHMPSFPEELRGMTCGAKTRAGTPCKQKGIYGNGRCKLHGGLSTGPRTKRGKRRSSLNWKKRKIFIGRNELHEMLRKV
jgi:hypothetical protein